LKCTHYNTGNISSATLYGEEISNSSAKKMIDSLLTTKVYYDCILKDFFGIGNKSAKIILEIKDLIK
jgi:hypothetical protein